MKVPTIDKSKLCCTQKVGNLIRISKIAITDFFDKGNNSLPLASVHPLNELIVHNNTAIVQLLVIYHSTFLIELINKSSQQNIQYQTVCFSVYFFGKNIRCRLFAVNVFFFCVTVLSPISVAFFDKIRQHQHSTFIYLPILLYKNQPSLDICYF